MLEGEVCKNVNFEGVHLINIDDGSEETQVNLGIEICKKNNFTFLKNSGRGLHAATKTMIEHVNKHHPNCKFVYWLTHDCYPLTSNIFSKLSSLIVEGKLDKFGVVGFNTIWKKFTMSEEQFKSSLSEGKYCGVMGRAVLTTVPGVGWYRPSDFPMTWDVWGKNIAVESVADMNIMINVHAYNKLIECDEWFHHFCWADDLCLQFLLNNVYNVTLGNFYVYHDQDLKTKYKIPTNSYHAAQSGNHYHFSSHDRHYARWKEKWGFDRNWQKESKYFDKNILEKYKNTLLSQFILHDYKTGPLEIFTL
jgi:hypothetical protein